MKITPICEFVEYKKLKIKIQIWAVWIEGFWSGILDFGFWMEGNSNFRGEI